MLTALFRPGNCMQHVAISTRFKLTFCRLPKETNESQCMTQKSDAYSYGTVIWELENALLQPAVTPISHLAPYFHVKAEKVRLFTIISYDSTHP